MKMMIVIVSAMGASMAEVTAELDGLPADAFAVKRWLRMSMDRLCLYPKAIYLEIGVDPGTWSRWTSYEHEQTLPIGYLAAVVALLDAQALHDLNDLITPKKKPGGNRA